jgi:hypothetical protein
MGGEGKVGWVSRKGNGMMWVSRKGNGMMWEKDGWNWFVR